MNVSLEGVASQRGVALPYLESNERARPLAHDSSFASPPDVKQSGTRQKEPREIHCLSTVDVPAHSMGSLI